MNQILQTENKKSGPIEINKIVIFFAIAMIILGIILIGQGSYAMIIGKNTGDEETQNKAPEVNIQRTEENILVAITHTKAIKNITYHWNEGVDQTIQTNDELTISEEITLPFGNNTLTLTVKDIDGNEYTYVKEYVLDGNGKPVIELLLTKENKIRIKVQDAQGLKYIRYTWNSGNYATVKANVENLKIIDELVEIPLGQNTLRVEAVNTEDMITTKELEVKGVRRPTLRVRQQENYLIIHVEDEVAIKVINFTLNGQKYQINGGEEKVIEHAQELKQGENHVDITVENKEGGIIELKNGICIVE